jgi:hypothetical protein
MALIAVFGRAVAKLGQSLRAAYGLEEMPTKLQLRCGVPEGQTRGTADPWAMRR